MTESARADLDHLKKAGQQTVLDAIRHQLVDKPLTETRNRKPLRPNNLANWEARIGLYRVFYDVEEKASKVLIKAIGWKEHNKLFIRGEEYEL